MSNNVKDFKTDTPDHPVKLFNFINLKESPMPDPILVPHNAKVLRAPTLDQIFDYLDNSPEWFPYIPVFPHKLEGEDIGWECVKSDDLGQPIRIINQVSGHEKGEWYKTESILDLLTAIENVTMEELVCKITETYPD